MEIEQVVLAHFQYIERVAAFLEGSGPDPSDQLTSADDCPMGAWLREHPNERLVELHERFHRLLDEAVALAKAGEGEKARPLLDEAYTLYSQLEHGLFD